MQGLHNAVVSGVPSGPYFQCRFSENIKMTENPRAIMAAVSALLVHFAAGCNEKINLSQHQGQPSLKWVPGKFFGK